MEHTPEEEERRKVIQRHLEGEKAVDIYESINRSKRWFNKWLARYKTGLVGQIQNRAQKMVQKPSKKSQVYTK